MNWFTKHVEWHLAFSRMLIYWRYMYMGLRRPNLCFELGVLWRKE